MNEASKINEWMYKKINKFMSGANK
jgi:hypothetical protein